MERLHTCSCVCSVSLYINIIKLLIYLVIIHCKLPVKLCFKTPCVFEVVTLQYMRYCSNRLSHIFYHVSIWLLQLFPSPPVIHVQGLNHKLPFSHSVMPDSLQHGLQHSRLPCPSLSLRICSNSRPLSQWCHPVISSFVAPFSSCLQFVPASGYFSISRLFSSGGQSIGASVSASAFPIQGWFPLGLTGLISLLSKGLSRVFFSITVRKHQFFSAQPSLWSNSHIHTWLLEKP